MKLTDSQRAAVTHRGSNLLVAASAGTGKTEVLARRCVALIADADQPCDIDRLLVVTFTRAAAAELRVRIARMLREEAGRVPRAGLRHHLRRQALLVDAAEIGTIDAWCGRIVREHYAQAGVDVGFSILGEQDAKVLRARVLDAFFDRVHRGTDPLAEQARAWIARATVPDDGFLRGLVARLNAFREHLVNPEAWFAGGGVAILAARGGGRDAHPTQTSTPPDDESAAVLAGALGEECRFQHAQLTARLAALPPNVAEALRPYRDALAGWSAQLARSAALGATVAAIAAFDIPKPNRRKKEPPEAAEVTEVRERWLEGRLKKQWRQKDVAAILKHAPATAAHVATLLRLEAQYQHMLLAAKRRQATYEFGDVLRMALDLLGQAPASCPWGPRAPTEIARRLQQRFAHILVDEYQDTSPVQVEILRLVTRAAPGQTNRFMVGDVKQSIYGFRQADPRLFAELSAALESGAVEGRIEYLSDNFRSHAGVLTALNPLFAALFDRALGGTAYGAQERFRPGRAAREIGNPTLDASPRVTVEVIEHATRRGRSGADDEEPAVEVIERETQLAAEQILQWLQAGLQVPRLGAEEKMALRPLRLADIVILLRSAAHHAGQVARILRANGIRCVTGGREPLFDAVEVLDACNVLKLLANRWQDIPLAGYLRSPWAGLSEAELLAVRAAAPPGADFYEAIERFRQARPDAALATRLDGALAQLDRWAVAALEEELPALLRRIFADSGALLLARALKGGAQRVALLRSLQGFAAQFAAAGGGSVAEFVSYLEALAEEEIEPGALAAGDEDVVRILTIHGAKGLEFPIVFLLGAGTKFNTRRQHEALQCDVELGLGLRFADYRARSTLASARCALIQRRIAQRELEEELRLLYVAATRARERLVIVGHAPPGTWDRYRASYAGAPPPLISRLSVQNRLEWVLMGAAAAGPAALPVTTRAATDVRVAARGAGEEIAAAPRGEPSAEDDLWVARGRELLTADVTSPLVDYPAVLSVSAVKELALRESAEDRPQVLDRLAATWPIPAFEQAAEAHDGRALGIVCHRFLELADLARLSTPADVQTQLDELAGTGRLAPEQAALVPVADVAWLGTTDIGALLGAHAAAARREVPFVHAVPLTLPVPFREGAGGGSHTIIRGVIDCLLDLPDGLLILDYKTDDVRSEQELQDRVAGYRVQLQLYAQAAEAIFGRPVARAAVAFLRARRVVDVPLTRPALADLLSVA
jgi:ATP-dependent helicase/nuclease subunit A